jgi:hypothetical protein
MKNIFIILLLALSFSGKADCYGIYQIEFEIIFKNGSSEKGYSFFSNCEAKEDSLKSSNYLKKILRSNNSIDSIVFFINRVKFDFKPFPRIEPETTLPIYKCIDLKNINKQDIESIKLVDYKIVSAENSIISNLEISDTAWINNTPFIEKGYWADLCSCSIKIYENNEDIDKIFKELDSLQAKITQENGDINAEKLRTSVEKLIEFDKVLVISRCSD